MAPRVAEHAARQLLRDSGITNAPTDLVSITNYLNLVVTTEALSSDVSGMLLRGERSVIAVNSSQSTRRRRFTVAHEIGHFLLHKGVYIDKDTRVNHRDTRASIGIDLDEVQANAFAAELLMPEPLLLREFSARVRKGAGSETAIVDDLAEIFDVSRQAMEIRLKVVGALAPF